jgi:hypothetical protein
MPKEMTDADDRRDHPRGGRCRGRVRCRPPVVKSSTVRQRLLRARLCKLHREQTRSRASSGRPSGNGKPSIVRTDGLSTRRSIDPSSARTLKATWGGWRRHGWTIPHTVNAASNVHVRLPGGDVPGGQSHITVQVFLTHWPFRISHSGTTRAYSSPLSVNAVSASLTIAG